MDGLKRLMSFSVKTCDNPHLARGDDVLLARVTLGLLHLGAHLLLHGGALLLGHGGALLLGHVTALLSGQQRSEYQ